MSNERSLFQSEVSKDNIRPYLRFFVRKGAEENYAWYIVLGRTSVEEAMIVANRLDEDYDELNKRILEHLQTVGARVELQLEAIARGWLSEYEAKGAGVVHFGRPETEGGPTNVA